ncbi:MAG: sigma-70 family RNA polymerase sigma factor [Steroidobacteraceae bacterium]
MAQAEDSVRSFVAGVAAQYGRRLRRFLAARLRNTAEAPDLVQEVYLRLQRVNRIELIRNPEAYLFTVASHLLNEHTLRQTAAPIVVEIGDVFAELRTVDDQDPAEETDRQQRLESLERALKKLSPKAQAALLLHRRDGYTLEEIAAQLGVSRAMVKKYLAKALVHCQRRLDLESSGTSPLQRRRGHGLKQE